MSETTTTDAAVLTLALSEIQVDDEFNPRSRFERQALDQLARSIAEHGVLVPVLVAPNRDGGYRLIAGGRRYRAAKQAGLERLPAVVRKPDEGSDGLDLALVENLAREALSPVDEAKAYRRLLDAGLTRKGIAERLSVAQRRVSDRLQVLELPTELHPKVASGEIPPGAIKALARLAGIHPGLPALAAAAVGAERDDGWHEPLSWSDVAEHPVAAVMPDHPDQADSLPAGVYDSGIAYPAGSFSLTDKAGRELAKLAELTGTVPEAIEIRFGREEVEQASALGAAHDGGGEWSYRSLIVGQDVADQLAAGYIAAQLREARARLHRERGWQRQRAKGDGGGPDGDGPAGGASSEEEEREQRRRERDAEQEGRRKAAAHNLELGAAAVKAFARVKLDERVVKLLATLNLGGELDQLAMRGARLGFPGWPNTVEQKNGKTRTIYIDRREQAGAKAREYLSVAKSAQEVAGRLVALVAMARYADERAVAQSAQSYYHLPIPAGLPWTSEIVDLIDELASERLPDHLTADKRAERAEQRAQEVERVALRQSIAERIARGSELTADERAQLREEIEQAYGRFSSEAHELNDRLDELDRALDEAVAGELAAGDEQSQPEAP